MPETKTMIRFFTIADYEEEEIWLHEQHKNGWKLHKMIPPCLYIFEKCTPRRCHLSSRLQKRRGKRQLFPTVHGLRLGVHRPLRRMAVFSQARIRSKHRAGRRAVFR